MPKQRKEMQKECTVSFRVILVTQIFMLQFYSSEGHSSETGWGDWALDPTPIQGVADTADIQ